MNYCTDQAASITAQPMRIPHLSRPESSEFYPILVAALNAPNSQWPIHVLFETKGGYSGNIRVQINEPPELEFDADWAGVDWTRFPARIRAAATALRDAGRFGSFFVEHKDGALRIAHVAVAG